jgi:hypothetical protein
MSAAFLTAALPFLGGGTDVNTSINNEVASVFNPNIILSLGGWAGAGPGGYVDQQGSSTLTAQETTPGGFFPPLTGLGGAPGYAGFDASASAAPMGGSLFSSPIVLVGLAAFGVFIFLNSRGDG